MKIINKYFFDNEKKNSRNKLKIFMVCLTILILFFVILNEMNNEQCYIPINITKDSIMRLNSEPRFLIPPPFINFCNQ